MVLCLTFAQFRKVEQTCSCTHLNMSTAPQVKKKNLLAGVEHTSAVRKLILWAYRWFAVQNLEYFVRRYMHKR